MSRSVWYTLQLHPYMYTNLTSTLCIEFISNGAKSEPRLLILSCTFGKTCPKMVGVFLGSSLLELFTHWQLWATFAPTAKLLLSFGKVGFGVEMAALHNLNPSKQRQSGYSVPYGVISLLQFICPVCMRGANVCVWRFADSWGKESMFAVTWNNCEKLTIFWEVFWEYCRWCWRNDLCQTNVSYLSVLRQNLLKPVLFACAI